MFQTRCRWWYNYSKQLNYCPTLPGTQGFYGEPGYETNTEYMYSMSDKNFWICTAVTYHPAGVPEIGYLDVHWILQWPPDCLVSFYR